MNYAALVNRGLWFTAICLPFFCAAGVVQAQATADLGTMDINGVQSKVTAQRVAQSPSQVIQDQQLRWKTAGFATINSASNGWQVVSSIQNGLLHQVQARSVSLPQGFVTEVVKSQMAIESTRKLPLSKEPQPVWIANLVDQGASILSRTTSVDSNMTGSTWFLKLANHAAALQVESVVAEHIKRAGFEEHPAGKIVGTANTAGVKHFSAAGGRQLAVQIRQSNLATVALITEYFPRRGNHEK